MPRPTVLSVEQALSMSYATLRFVHLGWRVIRIEPTPAPGRSTPGDPNRYVGRPVAGDDRHSYFVAPNVGKQAIAVNLKDPDGQALVRRLVRELPVDVFCTNTLPAHLGRLGIDHASLSREREDLIWCGISALGAGYPRFPGYDPVLQALVGFMDLTGDEDGPPLLSGPPLVDLKAGDEAFTQVLIALMERGESGRGKHIDISMGQVAASWLQTFLPLLDMGTPGSDLRRSGNEHRQFVPVNAYPTADGFLYLAVGSDGQWQKLVAEPLFAPLDDPAYATNAGRKQRREQLHRDVAARTRTQPTDELAALLARAGIPHSPITPIEGVGELEFVAPALLRTTAPDGRAIRLPPPAVSTPFLEARDGELPFAPGYGEHTDDVLAELGLGGGEIAGLRDRGVVA